MKRCLLTLGALWACAAEPSPARLDVTLVSDASEFHVVLADEEEPPVVFDCPGDSRCTAHGFRIPPPRGLTELTLKAPGYAFVDHALPARSGRHEVPLTALAPFEANAHFRTGITRADGEEAFLELAVTSETELGTPIR